MPMLLEHIDAIARRKLLLLPVGSSHEKCSA
jgi:LSD1 subclass zinc finger protein